MTEHKDVSPEEFAAYQRQAQSLMASILSHINEKHGLRGIETLMPEGSKEMNRLFRSHALAIIRKEIQTKDL